MEKEEHNPVCSVRHLQPENSRLIQLLRDEFPAGNEVSQDEHRLLLIVPAKDYERLGNLISRLHRFIEERLPERKNHLYIVIRDQAGQRENVFKFWKDT